MLIPRTSQAGYPWPDFTSTSNANDAAKDSAGVPPKALIPQSPTHKYSIRLPYPNRSLHFTSSPAHPCTSQLHRDTLFQIYWLRLRTAIARPRLPTHWRDVYDTVTQFPNLLTRLQLVSNIQRTRSYEGEYSRPRYQLPKASQSTHRIGWIIIKVNSRGS